VSPPAGPGAPAKILIVDDRAENLLALEAILHGLGHELVKATSGEEALKRLLTEDVAVILLDVQMPGMDGFETAHHVKARAKTADIPILFLTALDGAAHQAFRGYAAGAVDYLAKPFDPWVLRAKVAVFVELHQRRQELAAQAGRARAELAALRSPHLAALAGEVVAAVEGACGQAGTPPEATARLGQALVAARALRDALPGAAPDPLGAPAAPQPEAGSPGAGSPGAGSPGAGQPAAGPASSGPTVPGPRTVG
jgi:CheY-like chemotaxis protein